MYHCKRNRYKSIRNVRIMQLDHPRCGVLWKGERKRLKEALNSQDRKLENISKLISKQQKCIQQLECGHHTNKLNLIRKTLNKRHIKATEPRDASEKSSESYPKTLSDGSSSNLTVITTNQEKSTYKNLLAKSKDKNKLLNTNPILDNPDKSVPTPQDSLGVQRRTITVWNAAIAFTAIVVYVRKHPSPGQAIKMDKILLNDGSGYDIHTWIFTVPVAQHSFVEIDHEIFSTVILLLPLIQEGQLSVSGERMCTILVNRLED